MTDNLFALLFNLSDFTLVLDESPLTIDRVRHATYPLDSIRTPS